LQTTSPPDTAYVSPHPHHHPSQTA
jgi:hypothetical protein